MAVVPQTIRPGEEGDLDTVLGLLDKAVRWLVRTGRTDQWGTELFSESPDRRAQIGGMLSAGVLRIAEASGEAVGASVLALHPTAYVAPLPGPELYIHLLVTDPDFAGTGVGRVLVADAVELARRQRAEVLRVDCYAGGDGALVRAYQRLGFTPSTSLLVPRQARPPWPGQVLTMDLPAD